MQSPLHAAHYRLRGNGGEETALRQSCCVATGWPLAIQEWAEFVQQALKLLAGDWTFLPLDILLVEGGDHLIQKPTISYVHLVSWLVTTSHTEASCGRRGTRRCTTTEGHHARQKQTHGFNTHILHEQSRVEPLCT